jgi:hypothetical protein
MTHVTLVRVNTRLIKKFPDKTTGSYGPSVFSNGIQAPSNEGLQELKKKMSTTKNIETMMGAKNLRDSLYPLLRHKGPMFDILTRYANKLKTRKPLPMGYVERGVEMVFRFGNKGWFLQFIITKTAGIQINWVKRVGGALGGQTK